MEESIKFYVKFIYFFKKLHFLKNFIFEKF